MHRGLRFLAPKSHAAADARHPRPSTLIRARLVWRRSWPCPSRNPHLYFHASQRRAHLTGGSCGRRKWFASRQGTASRLVFAIAAVTRATRRMEEERPSRQPLLRSADVPIHVLRQARQDDRHVLRHENQTGAGPISLQELARVPGHGPEIVRYEDAMFRGRQGPAHRDRATPAWPKVSVTC